MSWWKKVWAWLKKYWKWLLFPIGILMALSTLIAISSARRRAVLPPDLDEETQRALRSIRTADEKRNEQIAELEAEKEEKLKDMSDDQFEELRGLKKATTEEVVAWFNRL